MGEEHIHFVTGRLAEQALRTVVEPLAAEVGFDYSIGVMPITVAALMTPRWIERHVAPPSDATRILLPGYCDGDLTSLRSAATVDVERGPKDLRALPEFFGQDAASGQEYGAYDIEIIAEINHAPQLALEEIRSQAKQLATSGADVIDVGCEPGDAWNGVAACVKALKDDGHRVSIDSMNTVEIELGVQAGAELVLSVNSINRDAAKDWGCEVVVIPDDPSTMAGIEETIHAMERSSVPFRIDPILEPIGCGFAASLGRYIDARHRYPEADLMMGIGNLTELTDVDSAGVNVLLLGICQELGIRSVLTTQVINWARTSVRECDLARRMVRYAVEQGVPAKHVEPRLVTLRDPRLHSYAPEFLEQLAAQIKDHNYRIFAEGAVVHLVSKEMHLVDADPFALFERLMATEPRNLDQSHAFYLGYEMAKALTALTLGKEYRQDEALDWGYLTVQEQDRHRGVRQ